MAFLVACVLAIASVALASNGASVDLTVRADKSAYAAGEPLRFTIALENRGSVPVTLSFRTAQRFDLRFHDSTGREVWRWSADQVFAQAVGEERIDPGRRRTWDAVVREPLPRGSYEVVASLAAVNLKVSATTGLTVR